MSKKIVIIGEKATGKSTLVQTWLYPEKWQNSIRPTNAWNEHDKYLYGITKNSHAIKVLDFGGEVTRDAIGGLEGRNNNQEADAFVIVVDIVRSQKRTNLFFEFDYELLQNQIEYFDKKLHLKDIFTEARQDNLKKIILFINKCDLRVFSTEFSRHEIEKIYKEVLSKYLKTYWMNKFTIVMGSAHSGEGIPQLEKEMESILDLQI